MNRPESYNTKQHEAILSFVASLDSGHVTAAQIVEHFREEGVSISRPTVYRHLDKLTQSGKLRRYTTDGVSGACYQHVNSGENCQIHLHLKCEGCGELQHLECEAFDDIQRHVFDEHTFEVNALKSVLYGKCGHCL